MTPQAMEDLQDRAPTLVQGTDACDILVMLMQKCREVRLGGSNRKSMEMKGEVVGPTTSGCGTLS